MTERRGESSRWPGALVALMAVASGFYWLARAGVLSAPVASAIGGGVAAGLVLTRLIAGVRRRYVPRDQRRV